MDEELDNLDFWREYDWDWKSPDDVKRFVEDAIEREVYEYAWGVLDEFGEEDFYNSWWYSVQNAIKNIALNFSESELKKAMEHFLEGDFTDFDPAIFDAMLKYVPDFPQKYPGYLDYIEEIMPESWVSEWWEFSWYPFIGRYLTWTFWGPESMARSENIDPLYLRRIFHHSINAENPYRTFRARVALATNPKCPIEILEYLWSNRNGADWLLRNSEEDVLTFVNGEMIINGNEESIANMKDEAKKTLEFKYPTNERWESGPGAFYVDNILDIEWEAEDATTCLLAAFAKNTGLSEEKYWELSKEGHPLVRYFLSKNPNIPKEMKASFVLESPTFTFTPYGGDASFTEEVTLK
mgnify:CR=1 FL=1